jgi:hypothetical protein
MNPEDLHARMHRLAKLVAGLGQEEALWRKCSAPVLAVERQEYMDAIYGALRSLETARIVLVKITQRLEKEASEKTAGTG